MTDPLNVFVTESNVDLYRSQAYECLDGAQRERLLRLVFDEESRMGARREHKENGERRLNQRILAERFGQARRSSECGERPAVHALARSALSGDGSRAP